MYPNGIVPDVYNCGVAVISRAEAFLYPEKALEVLAETSATELSDRLNRLRAVYLESISQACDFAAEDAKEERRLVEGSKKRKRLFPPTEQSVMAQVSPKRLRKSNFSSLPPAVLGIRPENKPWEDCLYLAAEASGFSGPRILKAFRNAPADQPIHKIVEVLQLICEVANAETLIQLKSILCEPTPLKKEFDEDIKRVINLHHLIAEYGDESFVAQYRRFECQTLYFEWFECQRLSESSRMKEEKDVRDNTSKFNKRHRVEDEAQGDRRGDNRDAQCHLKDKITRQIAAQGNRDERRIRHELNTNCKEGKILHAFLSLQDSRSARRHVRFLSLFPIYEKRKRAPVLDVVNHNPPEEHGILTKNIGGKKYLSLTSLVWMLLMLLRVLGLNQKLANYFGKALFIARPELQDIEPCYLPGGDDAAPPNTIRLKSEEDDVIKSINPAEISRLFKPDDIAGQQ